MKIVKAGYPDPTQFDPNHRYYDAKSTLDNPRWTGVDVAFVEKWPSVLSLDTLKSLPELGELALLRRGNRLSLMPLSIQEWNAILAQRPHC
jgi:predicted RNA-binding protein with PUA-like domain